MYVFRVVLMYLTPFALGGLYYKAFHSLTVAIVATVLMLGVTIWRREKAAAVYRAAVKDVHSMIKDERAARETTGKTP